MTPVSAVLTVPLSSVSLYVVDANGNATGSPVWSAPCLEDTQFKDTQITEFSTPSGTVYKIPHVLDESHEVTINGLQDQTFPVTRGNVYVMYVVWYQSDKGGNPSHPASLLYFDRTLFMVVDISKGIAGRGSMGEAGNVQSRTFSAAFIVETSGPIPAPGPASSTQA